MHLLSAIEYYLKASGTPPSCFGRAAIGDPSLVFELRRGREPRPRTIARIIAHLDAVRAGQR